MKGAGLNDTFKMTGFSEILGGLIRQEVIEDALDNRGIEVTDANRKAARAEIDAQLQQSQQAGTVDDVLVDWAVDTRAAQLALTDAVTDTDPAEREQALRDAYEQLKGDYTQRLPRARCSAPARRTPTPSRPGWTAATTSPRVAKEESTESQSAANGGNIGCGTVTQAVQFVGDSLTADAENGDILGPAQTNAVEGQTWIVAQVDSIQVQTFDAAASASWSRRCPTPTRRRCSGRWRCIMRRADVTVASKYGSWDAEGRPRWFRRSGRPPPPRRSPARRASSPCRPRPADGSAWPAASPSSAWVRVIRASSPSATRSAIDRVPTRFLRTSRHPSASLVGDAATFDHRYESADSFEEVYRAVVDDLLAAADEHGEVLYAVPGSPRVLERTVDLLVAEAAAGRGRARGRPRHLVRRPRLGAARRRPVRGGRPPGRRAPVRRRRGRRARAAARGPLPQPTGPVRHQAGRGRPARPSRWSCCSGWACPTRP